MMMKMMMKKLLRPALNQIYKNIAKAEIKEKNDEDDEKEAEKEEERSDERGCESSKQTDESAALCGEEENITKRNLVRPLINQSNKQKDRGRHEMGKERKRREMMKEITTHHRNRRMSQLLFAEKERKNITKRNLSS